MNTVSKKREIIATLDGPRMSYLVVAIIDGNEITARFDYHTRANAYVSRLCKDYNCKEV